jgi:hypothetical protein
VNATYKEIGGARVGLLNASWPFASLSATPDEIVISVLGLKDRFPRSAIELSRRQGILSVGLRVTRTVGDKSSITFWTFDFGNLKQRLEAMGYEVADSSGGS